jgi:hypothetical protein
MENSYVSNEANLDSVNISEAAFYREKTSGENSGFIELNYTLTAEVGKNFFHYMKSFNLVKDPELLVLPPNNHYYYNKKELKIVRTIINLKQLNLIENHDVFLSTLYRILPPGVNFLGCFSDSRSTLRENGFLSILTSRINNFLDSRIHHVLDKKRVSGILEKNGFRVVDMTEKDGLVYFYSRNVCQPVKITF